MRTDGPSKDEVKALISISNGALTPREAVCLLRRYDNNLHKAAVVVLDRPDVKSPTRIQTQRPHRIGLGKSKGEPTAGPEPETPPLLPFKNIGVGPGGGDDTIRCFEVSQLESQSQSQSQSRPHANPPMRTLDGLSAGSEDPEETLKPARAERSNLFRIGTQRLRQDEINMGNAYAAVRHSTDTKDKPVMSLQNQVEQLRERLKKVAVRLEGLARTK